MQILTRCSVILALATSLSLPHAPASASELVMVQVQDGRVLVGEVDHRTDEQSLWVRVTSPTLVLSTSVPWEKVAWVQYGNQQLRADDFRGIAGQLATKLPKRFFDRPQRYTHPRPDTHEDVRNGRLYVVPPIPPQEHAETVTVRAQAANWDGDAEYDGVEVTVAPHSAAGEVVPLDGQLVIALVGRRYRTTRRQPTQVELDQWSRRVHADDFGTWGATYRIPFRSFDAQHDRSCAIEGRLDVQFTGGRTGRLKASVPIRLCPYDPLSF